MRYILSLGLILCLSFGAFAQRQETLLSDLNTTGLWIGWTFNYTSYNNDWDYLQGFFGGLEVGRNAYIGYGRWKAKPGLDIMGAAQDMEMRHGGLILGVSPGSYRAIHPTLQFVIGPGRTIYDDGFERQKDRFLAIKPSAGLEFNLFESVRLNIEGGYLLVTGTDFDTEAFPELEDVDLSAPFLQLNLKFGFSWD
jgi:hypothetical protein